MAPVAETDAIEVVSLAVNQHDRKRRDVMPAPGAASISGPEPDNRRHDLRRRRVRVKG